ncbi:MAG: extracellular solute-binding protein [Beijerinckiaceae bacterium]|nr:extracellular solute-binding protein [Beijerinckiaceae bacterium]
MQMNRSRMILLAVAAAAAGVTLAPARIAAQTNEQILLYDGPDREKRLLEGARKEGQVIIYSAMIVNQALRPLVDSFNKKYPGVRASYWRGDSEDIAAKLAAESRAKNLSVDVVEGTGVGELVIEANLVQPFFTPEINGVPENLRDPRKLWAPTRVSYFSVAYNTRLVPPEKAPKTFEDLLDPQWKGKISWRIGSSSGTPLFITNLRTAWGEDKAMAYFRKLADQKIVNFGSGSARTLVDRVIAGEYPIALNIFAHHPLISAAKGAPVASQLMDPVATTTATAAIPKGVRRPHAALLLVDFIVSKEGQEILSKADYFPVRLDVDPKPELAAVVPSKAGVPQNFILPETLGKYGDSSEKIFQDIFR